MTRLPPTIIVDANIAVKWVIAEADSIKARATAVGRTLLAPEFMLVESANILWKHQRRGEVGPDFGIAAFAVLQKAPFVWTRDAELVGDARRLSAELDHPVYDCLYLALALRHGAPVITADRRFAALAQKSAALSSSLIALDSLA